MLGTYQPTLTDNRNTVNAFFASSLMVAGILGICIQVTPGGAAKNPEKEVDVTFVEEIKLKPKEPIEMPKIVPPAPQPVVAKNIKKIFVKKPISIKKLKVPVRLHKGKLAESDASQDKGVLLYEGAENQIAQALPQSARPPVGLPGNRPPVFPATAKKDGKSGLVVLKLVIDEKGYVADVRVLRGAVPFTGAAVQAVKGWRYRPATIDGEAFSVYHVVKIPFRYRA